MAAFVLVAHKGRPVESSSMPLAERQCLSILGFIGRASLVWTDRSGSVVLRAWHDGVEGTPPPWFLAEDDLAMSVGYVRWRGMSWTSPTTWAEQLIERARMTHVDDLSDDLVGIFGALHLTADGDGWLIADPLGFRCVYLAENDDMVVVSSRAALAAEALTLGGGHPGREAIASCWLAFMTNHIGDSTGFTGVRVLDPGAVVELRAGRARVRDRPPRWLPSEELRGLPLERLVELARDDIAENLAAILTFPAERHVIRLTGGVDSRLMLAVALWAGIADRFFYETIGPPDLVDVEVASELAELFGLNHGVRFLGMAPSEPYEDRARWFVEATAGMVSIWDLDGTTGSPDVFLTGLCGEALRRYLRPWNQPPRNIDELVHAFRRELYGSLGLVRPDVADRLHRELVACVLEPGVEIDPLDLVHAFSFQHPVRYSRFGPREELPGDLRMHPLYAMPALLAAMALGGPVRESEILVARLIEQCSPELANHRYAGQGFSRRPSSAPPADRVPPRPPSGAAPGVPLKSPTLMARLNREGADRRVGFLREVASDAANPAWDVIDRPKVIAALDRYASLQNAERRQLFGAITAVVWMHGDSSA